MGSELLLEGGALLGEILNPYIRLKPHLPNSLGDQLGIGADLVDLVDDESFDLDGAGHWSQPRCWSVP